MKLLKKVENPRLIIDKTSNKQPYRIKLAIKDFIPTLGMPINQFYNCRSCFIILRTF